MIGQKEKKRKNKLLEIDEKTLIAVRLIYSKITLERLASKVNFESGDCLADNFTIRINAIRGEHRKSGKVMIVERDR